MRCSIWIFEVAFNQRQLLHFRCLMSRNSQSSLHYCCSPQQTLLRFFSAFSENSLSIKRSSLMSNMWLPLEESNYQHDLNWVELIDSWNCFCFQPFCSLARRFETLEVAGYSWAGKNSDTQVQVDCNQNSTVKPEVYQHSFDREEHP